MKKWPVSMFRSFVNLGIREKLLLSFALLISLPVMVIALRSYTVSSSIVERKTNQYSHDILYQTTKTLETRLDKIEDISFNVAMNYEVQSILFAARNGNLEAYEENQMRIQIEAILSSQVLYHDEINAIYVVSAGGYVYELDKTKQNYGLMEEKLPNIQRGMGSNVWFGGLANKRVVALTRVINSTRTQLPIGYLVMYVDESFLFDLLKRTHSVQEGELYLINTDGIIVSSADKSSLGKKARLADNEEETTGYSFAIQSIDGVRQYVARSEPMHNGWRIVTTVPVLIYQKEIIALRNSILFFSLLVLVVAVLGAWALSVNIARPIRRLTSAMERFGQGDFSVRSPEEVSDETGKLAKSFNSMAENINDLVRKVYEEQLMKRDAELKSLQMQINPHFLYNTLETINWMARAQNAEEIAVMAKSLGDLMRATINGKDYVLLKEEMSSLQNYLQIQKCRYRDKFVTEIHMDPKTELLLIPKLVIQPLVENAIYHGIEPAFDAGKIQIVSKLEGQALLIQVMDEGVGMTQEKIASIMDSTSRDGQASQNSIGLQNVIKRIQTLFGNGYGLSIQSELGEGTVITIRLPVLKKVIESMEG